jgi:hypothetical protein
MEIGRFVRVLVAAVAVALANAVPSLANACALDGIASISLNGTLAVLTTDAPQPDSLNTWARFTFGLAYAPHDVLHLAEDMGKLRRSLPEAALHVPFIWSFGDGQSVRGMQATHRYDHPGWYKIAVQSYWPSGRGWVLFDSVRVHIVPASSLFQENLGYRIVQAVGFLGQVVAYGGILLIAAAMVWPVLRQRRRRARATVASKSSHQYADSSTE